jgi:hypothetical protein
MPAVTDIVMLTHNRLEHLVATVDALETRTRAPYRLTIVDNASDPELRNWLSANEHRFHQVIRRPRNEFLPALNHGIEATASDPFMVTDPDLVVPDLDPCWLSRMHDILDRHPDFGLLGIGLDQSNLPSVQAPESIDPSEIVDGEIVERPVGSVLTLIRRNALRSSYETDWRTCQSVARAGYRYGWTPEIRAHHLGWDDYRLYPAHLANKLQYGEYREVKLMARPPTLPELALAGPLLATTRELDVPDASVLELTWSEPAIAAASPSATAVRRPDPRQLRLNDTAAGAVVLVDPPARHAASLLATAVRAATTAVIAVASLEDLGGRSAAELAPAGWTGREAPGPGDLPLALADAAAANPALVQRLGVSTLDDREHWLSLFAAGAFGGGARRLWIWEPAGGGTAPPPAAVRLDPRLERWQAVAVTPTPPHRTVARRIRDRARREARVAGELVRLHGSRMHARLRSTEPTDPPQGSRTGADR